MSNKFSFEICAVDRFTKTFKNLNDKASKATRPLQATGRQFKALGKEMHLDKVAKGLSRISATTENIGRNLGLATGPLQSLTGLALGGGLAGAAAAIASTAAKFADIGTGVGRAASLMNVSDRDLQRFQGAAKLTGLSTDTATQSLNSFGRALQDAVYRGGEGREILNKFGVQIRQNKDGTIDAIGTLEDYSRAISRIKDPRAQQKATEPFGMEAMLPLLRQGPDAMRKLGDEAEKRKIVLSPNDIGKATKFTNSLNRLKASAEGVQNVVGGMAAGPLTRWLDKIDASMAKANAYWSSPNAGFAPPDKAPQRMVDITLGTESNGQRYGKDGKLLRSPVGALGEMQVMPYTNKDPGFGVRPAQDDSPDEMARVGRDYLGAMYRRYGNDPAKAWAAYNAGPGALDQRVKKYGDRWLENMPAETQGYVAKNMRALNGPATPPAVVQQQTGAPQMAAAQAQPQAIEVKVKFENAPPGTSATATGMGNSSVPARVSYAMPTDGLP